MKLLIGTLRMNILWKIGCNKFCKELIGLFFGIPNFGNMPHAFSIRIRYMQDKSRSCADCLMEIN